MRHLSLREIHDQICEWGRGAAKPNLNAWQMSLAHHMSLEEAKMIYTPHNPLICVDFDGVLHSYTSGWKGPHNIPDPPIRGAIEWLKSLIDSHFRVQIFSARCNEPAGIEAMRQWLFQHGLEPQQLQWLTFMPGKPKAYLIIDDRAWQFTGGFPSVEVIRNFKPWRVKETLAD